jgi:hypothetical protein
MLNTTGNKKEHMHKAKDAEKYSSAKGSDEGIAKMLNLEKYTREGSKGDDPGVDSTVSSVSSSDGSDVPSLDSASASTSKVVPVIETADDSEEDETYQHISGKNHQKGLEFPNGQHASVEASNSLPNPHFHSGDCVVDEMNANMDKYIKHILMKSHPGYTKRHAPAEDRNSKKSVKGYHSSQLDFYDRVNGSSKDNADAVDKMNKRLLNGSEQCGVKIQDVYDKMTTGNIAAEARASERSHANVLPNYKSETSTGKTYDDDMWRYSNEKVSNGGQFYGGIKAVNNGCDDYMIY